MLRTAPANVLTPGGGAASSLDVAALFIDSTGDILKCKLNDGTILIAKVGGVNVAFV